MVNYIWAGMIIIGVVYSIFNGTLEDVNESLFTAANEAVTLCIGLISVLVFWLGMMRIAEKTGLLNKVTTIFKPLVEKLFPDIPKNHPAMDYILSNIIANMFGLGNAATPLGIKAMEQLQKLNKKKEEASRSMITFLALNTSGLTLIPTTVLAIRMKYDSQSPTDIVVPTLIATICATIAAILIDRFFYYRRKKRGEK